jgi:hypothetical protein
MMNFSIPYVVTINLPVWVMVIGVAVLLMTFLGWRIKAYAIIAGAFVMAGMIQFPLVNAAIKEVSKLTN